MLIPLGSYMASEKATFETYEKMWTETAQDWSREKLISMIAHKHWCYHRLQELTKFWGRGY